MIKDEEKKILCDILLENLKFFRNIIFLISSDTGRHIKKDGGKK